MIAEYVTMDRRHDDLFERFMEQRFQQLNNSEQSSMVDSLPFPIEPLRTVATAFPKKAISNTSGDWGVNSLQGLPSAMPVTYNNFHYPQSSASRMDSPLSSPSGPKTPIQQFIHNSRKIRNKEPKCIRSHPDHPDPQSVLRSRFRQGYKLKTSLCPFISFCWYGFSLCGTDRFYTAHSHFYFCFRSTWGNVTKSIPTAFGMFHLNGSTWLTIQHSPQNVLKLFHWHHPSMRQATLSYYF